MSGGALVLGGIVAIPLVFIAAKGTHKKAKEIEEEIAKVEAATTTLREQLDAMPNLIAAVEARGGETNVECQAFAANVSRLIKAIRPWGILSLMKQRVYLRFGKNPFSDKQLIALNELDCKLAEFLLWFHNSKPTQEKAQPRTLVSLIAD
jgi:hypothetical protein